MIKKESTLPTAAQEELPSEDNVEDSDSEKGFFTGSAYHEQFTKDKKKKKELQPEQKQALHYDEYYLRNRQGAKIAQMSQR